MSERRSSADLGQDAEALLAAFPFPERDWDSDARAIEARFAEAGTSDALLLAAPLPAEPGEPHGISATTTPLTNSGVRTQSLAELARRSVEKKQAEQREMARASLAIAARKAPAVVAPPSVARTVESGHVETSAVAPELPAARVVATPSAWPKLALGVPLLALAAAALLWLRRPAEPAPLSSNAQPTASDAAKPSVAATTATAAATAAAARAPTSDAPSVPQGPQGIDPSTLPSEVAAKPSEEVAHSSAIAAAASSPVARAKPGKVAPGEQPAAAIAAAPAPASEKVELGLPPDPGLRPADSSGGQLPVKPSSGAVQAALGTVLSGARHCVAGDDAPSSAVVQFGSDGRVQSVSVSGPAAGKASGQCIQAQLTKARVQPFAASNFSVNATIRPD